MVFDALTRHESGVLSTSFFKSYIGQKNSDDHPVPQGSPDESKISFVGRFPTLREVEDFFIDEAMTRSQGNQSVAARLLGVSQSTLSRRFKKKE